MEQNRVAILKISLNLMLASLVLSGLALAQEPAAPSGLMCELMARPESAGIADSTPEFSWIVPANRQTACQILVGSDQTILDKNQADVWDSSKVVSTQSTGIEYAGKPLSADRTYFWKVRVWTSGGNPGPYSHVQAFRTGTLDGSYETTQYPLATTVIQPARVVKKGEGHYFVDFGKAAFGTVELTLTSPAAGTKVQVHLGEVPAGDSVERNPGGTRRYRMMTLTLQEATHTYKVAITPDAREYRAAGDQDACERRRGHAFSVLRDRQQSLAPRRISGPAGHRALPI